MFFSIFKDKYAHNLSILMVVKARRDWKVRLEMQYVGFWYFVIMLISELFFFLYFGSVNPAFLFF